MTPTPHEVNLALREHFGLALSREPAGPTPIDFFTNPRLTLMILEEFNQRFWHTLGQWETAFASHPTLMGALAMHAYAVLAKKGALLG